MAGDHRYFDHWHIILMAHDMAYGLAADLSTSRQLFQICVFLFTAKFKGIACAIIGATGEPIPERACIG